MLLSRVAETLYWMGRYVERAEDTARMVLTHTNLVLDLPRQMRLGWEHLLTITGSGEQFYGRFDRPTEERVVRFLVGDPKNPSSVLSSLYSARENLRTTRAVIPRAAWEALDEVYRFAQAQVPSGVTRRGRYDYLRRIIEHTQLLVGLLDGTMSHDRAYDFLCMGQALERADMMTRLMDVQVSGLWLAGSEDTEAFEDIQWMGVLRSVSAYQMYRRHVQVPVTGSQVLAFLLQDREFPRSVAHCLQRLEACLRGDRRSEAAVRVLERARLMASEANTPKLASEGLHDFLDSMQIVLAAVHDELTETYFCAGGPLVPRQRLEEVASE